jgi:hypothetical protein|nr:MAG TPA_asm: hypothetical protein [Caudoviricetes sp.]
MNKEEICFKLIEFYYLNKPILDFCHIDLDDLFDQYNKMLEVLKSR